VPWNRARASAIGAARADWIASTSDLRLTTMTHGRGFAEPDAARRGTGCGAILRRLEQWQRSATKISLTRVRTMPGLPRLATSTSTPHRRVRRGSGSATLMLIGEQPGDAEDLSGRPFVGPAGKLPIARWLTPASTGAAVVLPTS